VLALAPCGQNEGVSLTREIHRRITEGKEAMARAHARKARRFPIGEATKEGLHGCIQAIVDFGKQFPIHLIEFRIIGTALSQRLLAGVEAPLLSVSQFHHPPIVEASAFALHELKGGHVLLAEVQFDLFAQDHEDLLSFHPHLS
jgi:hypothetical protein